MKVSYFRFSSLFLRMSVITGLFLALTACGQKEESSETNAARANCVGEGSFQYDSDGSNVAICSVTQNVGYTYAKSENVQGGTQISAEAVDFASGEKLYDAETWTDANYGKNDDAVSANVCRSTVSQGVVDKQGRTWGYENGASCIAI